MNLIDMCQQRFVQDTSEILTECKQALFAIEQFAEEQLMDIAASVQEGGTFDRGEFQRWSSVLCAAERLREYERNN